MHIFLVRKAQTIEDGRQHIDIIITINFPIAIDNPMSKWPVSEKDHFEVNHSKKSQRRFHLRINSSWMYTNSAYPMRNIFRFQDIWKWDSPRVNPARQIIHSKSVHSREEINPANDTRSSQQSVYSELPKMRQAHFDSLMSISEWAANGIVGDGMGIRG